MGSNLIADKKTLVLWIRGLQDSFADLYILAKRLKQDCTELHLLKSFLVVMVENMKTRVNDLMNDKEDMVAMHQSDSSVKEHLIQRVNEQEKINMERATETLFLKKRVQELLNDKLEVDEVREQCQKEASEMKHKLQKDIKALTDCVQNMNQQN